MLRARLVVVLLFAGACEPPEPGPQTARLELVGATDDTTLQYPAVFMVRSEWNNMVPTHCSATLIAPRVLLLAGHCVDPRKANSTAVTLYAMNVSPRPMFPSPEWVQLNDPVFHPDYTPSDFRDPEDLALVLLPLASSAAPIPYNSASLDAGFTGLPLTAVGFGITSPGVLDHGTRRSVALTFRAVTATHIRLGDMTAKGICNGDSGGPSLHTFPDGVTRVVGVHSYTEPGASCLDGADVRVDRFAGFIRQYLSDKVGPWCGEDGLCGTGCTGVDPDCVPVLGACTDDAQCQHRQCRADPQRPERYCTEPCPCSSGTCVAGACLKPQLPPPVTLEPPPDLPAAPKTGCSTAPGSLLVAAALLLLRRRNVTALTRS